MAAVIGLVGCAGYAAVIGWISRLLLWLVVRTRTPRSEAWFGGEDEDPMLLGEEIDTSPPSFGLFLSTSHQTELYTRSMTRSSDYRICPWTWTPLWAKVRLPLFVTASYQIGINTRSITWRSIIVEVEEKGVGINSRLEPCWSMLVNGSLSAMWARWTLRDMDINISPRTDAWL